MSWYLKHDSHPNGMSKEDIADENEGPAEFLELRKYRRIQSTVSKDLKC